MKTDYPHSPGPWCVSRTGSLILDRMGRRVAKVVKASMIGTMGIEESRINRALIASAPDLLAALEETERRFARIACGELAGMAAKHSAQSGLETVRAAIAKTLGQTP